MTGAILSICVGTRTRSRTTTTTSRPQPLTPRQWCAPGVRTLFTVRRAGVVTGLLRSCSAAGVAMHCLGATKSGAPRHPLYVHRATQRVPFGEVA
jgi:hypothetical protein